MIRRLSHSELEIAVNSLKKESSVYVSTNRDPMNIENSALAMGMTEDEYKNWLIEFYLAELGDQKEHAGVWIRQHVTLLKLQKMLYAK